MQNRKFFFSCETKQEMEIWMKKLQEILSKLSRSLLYQTRTQALDYPALPTSPSKLRLIIKRFSQQNSNADQESPRECIFSQNFLRIKF